MKKIGTITFHRSLNYGSVLQTYALQKTIKKITNERKTEVIDFYPPGIQKIRSVFVPIHSFKNVVHNVVALVYYPSFIKRKKSFDMFLNNNICLSKRKYVEDSDMGILEEDYDFLIAGSDQIWNNRTTDFSIQYFYPTVRGVRKIAYAPSLGNAVYTLPLNQQVYDALMDFYAISVRELSGAKKIKSFIHREVPVVVDPTLLLSAEDYVEIESAKKLQKKKYIFLYSVNMERKTLKIANAISKCTGLPIVSIYTTNGSFRAVSNGIKLSKDAAPGDFLNLIHYAELVISDSFHGTAFSINYHKKFYSVCVKDINRRDPRLETLLSKLELKNRMLFFDDYERENYLGEINYCVVDKRLSKLREESLDFLKWALQEGDK